jgi:hypothetical protein
VDYGCLREAAMRLRLFLAVAWIRRLCEASKVVLG